MTIGVKVTCLEAVGFAGVGRQGRLSYAQPPFLRCRRLPDSGSNVIREVLL